VRPQLLLRKTVLGTKSAREAILAVCILLAAPGLAQAYIGPGAGFALAGSLLAVFAAVFSASLMLLTWPLRLAYRLAFGRRALKHSRFQRVVVLGLDGMDYGLTSQMLAAGKLPNFAALAAEGCFKPLGSTLPPISPVAWSSFQTGVNPGKHNVFDFLEPDRRTYRPKLSSVDIRPPRRIMRLGKYQLPLGKARVRLMRKSKPFWSVLSEHGIFSAVLRVPITFPPEKLRGVLLSAMCVPDLRGTQGMFSYYTTKPQMEGERTGGEVQVVARNGDQVHGELIGPPNPLRSDQTPLKVPFDVIIRGADVATLKIGRDKHELRRGEYTPWIQTCFRAGPGIKVYGLCRFLLLETGPEFGLYVTPINIDPEKPAMPVSYPSVYSVYLAKQQGPFATLGLAEDTWSLNEHIIDDDQFIQQCVDADLEREAMFFDSLDKVPRGLCVCVFDGTDRLQHTFWRDIDETHPARAAYPATNGRNVIDALYRRMDDLVGRTRARCGKDTFLLVISDHGFNSFRRGIDLNLWLAENGYLKHHAGREGEEYLAGVDWSRSRAFALGLAGIFINEKDKYAEGIVEPGDEAARLRTEIAAKLVRLTDPQNGASAIKGVYQTQQIYRGPYKDNAPDLVVGYQRGYRVAWETAVGKTTEAVFHDNCKAWSGDHCVDPSLVPGILFCNQTIETENTRLLDIGPTVLDLFGVRVPEYMDGKVWKLNGECNRGRSQ
jgi:predicted AlkP superfamily phosphohydrolase/phosphomutase